MIGRFVALAAAALLTAPGVSRGQSDTAGAPFAGAVDCAARLERAGIVPPPLTDERGRRPLAAQIRSAAGADDDPDAKARADQLAVYYTGADRVADICPDLAAAMAGERGADLIVGGADAPLTPGIVWDAAELARRYARPAGGAPSLSNDDLVAAVGALPPFEPEAAQSVWDRFVEWLGNLLEPESGEDGFWDRLDGFRIPPSWVPWIVRVIGVAIVLGALAVLVNELRHAGVLSRGGGRRRARRRGSAAEALAASRVDWRSAPPRRQPALLLAVILDRLRARGALASGDGLTHRELVAAAGALTPPQRSSFASVAGAAERVTFGGWQPQAADVAAVLTRGEALLDELASAPDAAATR
ncbi:MAG: hypothetical protein JXB36_18560 [Gammaproteobacteria bacterium]|nr:hypothetical protein [Gammaproteobacteria bacterium]